MTSPSPNRPPRLKINGWVILDKPSGITSARAVDRVRNGLWAKKAGHGGTLDPMATGVLPIALGEATKTIGFIMDASKDYSFTVKWGEETDTDDSQGNVTRKASSRPSASEIEAALSEFTGTIMQAPPAYSAIKIDGKRSYERARNNEKVEIAPRQINVQHLELLETDNTSATFAATTGKGAYIRSLARDIGRYLGSAGHITALRRHRVGVFSQKSAISLDFFDEMDNSPDAFREALHPVLTALDDIPAIAITDDDATRLRCGQKIAVSAKDDVAIGLQDGELVAIIDIEGGVASPRRVFNLQN